jgi:hypothetical protein
MRFEVIDFVRFRGCSIISAASACPRICPGYEKGAYPFEKARSQTKSHTLLFRRREGGGENPGIGYLALASIRRFSA